MDGGGWTGWQQQGFRTPDQNYSNELTRIRRANLIHAVYKICSDLIQGLRTN